MRLLSWILQQFMRTDLLQTRTRSVVVKYVSWNSRKNVQCAWTFLISRKRTVALANQEGCSVELLCERCNLTQVHNYVISMSCFYRSKRLAIYLIMTVFFSLLNRKMSTWDMTMSSIDLPHIFRAITAIHEVIGLPTCPVVPFINASEIRGHQRK